MQPTLIDMRMYDGSRCFGDMAEREPWDAMYGHIPRLVGAVPTDFITEYVTEVWIDFRYHGHDFSINNQHGEYWLFVNEPACPNDLLHQVLTHCDTLLA